MSTVAVHGSAWGDGGGGGEVFTAPEIIATVNGLTVVFEAENKGLDPSLYGWTFDESGTPVPEPNDADGPGPHTVVYDSPGEVGVELSVNQIGFQIVYRVLASNVVTITSDAPHGLVVGTPVEVRVNWQVATPAFDGTFPVASVPTPTTFTYAKTGANVPGAATEGNGYYDGVPPAGYYPITLTLT